MWGLTVDDGNPHFFHQEAGVHVLRHARTETVGEGQLIVGDIRFEAEVADILWEKVNERTQQQVVGGDDAVCL